jgi:hypothetical protein
MSLCGTGKDHCCWFSGEVCQYVKPSEVDGFNLACSLRTKYGSWESVHASPEYTEHVKDKMNAVGGLGLNCGDWPNAGHKCNTCGEVG